MKLALISLSKDDDESGFPIGLLPLFDSNIVHAQVRAAVQAGAQKIIFLSPAMPGPLLAFVDQLKRDNIDAEVVRTVQDLGHYAAAKDELLFVSDGILWDENIAAALRVESGERIFVTSNNTNDNGDSANDFELIDSNHRWLGIARLKASRLSEVQDIPPDWDTGSALLRTAVQAHCHREKIAPEKVQNGAVRALKNTDSLVHYTNHRLMEPKLRRGNFIERSLIWPLGRRLLPRLWKFSKAADYSFILALILSTAAVIYAYISWPVMALLLLIFSVLSRKISEYITIFSENVEPIWMKLNHWINALAILVVFFNQSLPDALLPNIVICFVLLATAILNSNESEEHFSDILRPDSLMILFILFVGAIFGYVALGLYAAIIFSAVCLLNRRFEASRKD